ncbi:MAG: membrane dipeptidase [Verrucomicrobia bacterium]|nr:membrane dipeptidase [Verrucomicrobiota bacterium]
MPAPLIFDAHLDLAMNAIEWNRDLTRPLAEIRSREAHLRDKPDRGRGTVSLPEMRRGRIAVCVATQLARLEHDAYSPVFGWRSPAQAWAMTQAQLAWYRAMEESGEMVAITNRATLEAHLALWRDADDATATRLPIGYLRSLEGADSLITLDHLARAHADGLRALGPAHYGPGVYAQGTNTTGPFPPRGLELLRVAGELGLILDLTHLSDDCCRQALELYRGPLWASHHNARTLVPHQRQLADEQFLALASRGGVVGVCLDAWMMIPHWTRGQTTPQSADLHLTKLVEHIDHYCQLAGNARHVGLGTDLDGAFGTEQTPQDLDSIADLQRLPALLRARGYAESDIAGILSENFLRFLRTALP